VITEMKHSLQLAAVSAILWPVCTGGKEVVYETVGSKSVQTVSAGYTVETLQRSD